MSALTRRQRRMAGVVVLLLGIGGAAVLGFTAFRKNMMYFYTPTDLLAGVAPSGAQLQLGGLVEKGSLKREDGLKVSFVMADCEKQVAVSYTGILPDLFREGQGVIATGTFAAGGANDKPVFAATRILAKHDENYMPPQLAQSLKTADGKHSCAPFKSVYKPVTAASTPPPGVP